MGLAKTAGALAAAGLLACGGTGSDDDGSPPSDTAGGARSMGGTTASFGGAIAAGGMATTSRGASGGQDACFAAKDPPCFQPCGGDPSGKWQLERSCFATREVIDGDCKGTQTGIDEGTQLSLEFLPSEYSVSAQGTESWSFTTRVAPACVPPLQCTEVYSEPKTLLFSFLSRTWYSLNSCGLCEAANREALPANFTVPYVLSGTFLQIGASAIPFCVTGNQLWIGGANDGQTVSYLFTRH